MILTIARPRTKLSSAPGVSMTSADAQGSEVEAGPRLEVAKLDLVDREPAGAEGFGRQIADQFLLADDEAEGAEFRLAVDDCERTFQ